MQNSSRRDLTNESCDLAVIENPAVAFFQEFQIDFSDKPTLNHIFTLSLTVCFHARAH